jgi:isoleucyl-tRNA synthetase
VLADALAAEVMSQARVDGYLRLTDVPAEDFATLVCAHPLRNAGLGGYGFDVPLLPGDHVTEETGPALSTPLLATAGRTSRSGWSIAASWRRAASM